MIEITSRNDDLVISDSSKNEISFNKWDLNVVLDWFEVSHPWEYEKSWILLEVKEYSNVLFYNFLMEWKRILIVPSDTFELKEEIMSFFWDVDILVITWTKNAAKIFESIEAKVVVPYWEWKDVFLNTLGQHSEEETIFKVKSELPVDSTLFVNVK